MLDLFSLLPIALTVTPTDPRLFFEGRWEIKGDSATADWPCSGIKFRAMASAEGAVLQVFWAGVRSRVRATIMTANTTSSAIWNGPELELPFHRPEKAEVLHLPPGSSLVSLRKLNSATPYAPGIASDLFHASLFDFRGLEVVAGNATIEAVPARPRRIEVIGASDSAGYCVDGTPNTTSLQDTLLGWKYSDCDGASGAELARRLEADISVQALAGAGLTQNANARQRWQLGKRTMADYYTRTLQSDAKTPWNMSAHAPPQLVLVSLGGNDFNHQNGHVPSNATFEAAYVKLLGDIFRNYQTRPGSGGTDDGATTATDALTVVSICGQGSPQEAKFDPDNNRCRPCPHVESAVQAFQQQQPARRAEYIFVPCDGSVVTGEGDIGCNGHKNRQGQLEVATFLEPRLRTIMGWGRVDTRADRAG